MNTHKAKFLSAAVIATALIATVAIGRTVHTHTVGAGAQPAQHSSTGDAPDTLAHAPLRGSLACGSLSFVDCQRLGQMLPM
ncbi:MAG: hypothetical protein ACREB8_09755 [Pseudolabrys sp.]